MRSPLLSTCMIVRDEEDCLERCLASIRPFTDELILVDTGSTDGTVTIAERYADRLIHHPWEDDFSAARNRSIERAAGDWIFYLDADEELFFNDGPKLRKMLSEIRKNVDHLLLSIRNLDGAGGILSEFPALRIFRNGRGIHFSGIVHNQVICNGEGRTFPVTLLHYGYALSPKKMEAKFQRTLSLTKKQIRQEPSSPLPLHNLTLSLLNHGDHAEALESGLQGLRLFEQLSAPYPPLFSNLIYLTARAALADGRYDLAASVCMEGLKSRPDHLDLFWVLAMSSYYEKQYRETLEWSKKFRQAVRAYREHRCSELPVNTIGRIAPLLITAGYAAAHLGCEPEAQRFMEEGLAEGKWDPELGIKILNFCNIHQKRELGETILQQLLHRHPDHAELHRFRAVFSLSDETVSTPSIASSPSPPQKVLIINLCELGDLIQATPVIEEITFRGGAVTLLVREDLTETALHLPQVSRIVTFDTSTWIGGGRTAFVPENEIRDQIGGLLDEPFDLILNMTYTRLGARIARMSRGKQKKGMVQAEGNRIRIRGASIRYLRQMLAHRKLNTLHVVDLHRLILRHPLQRRELSFQVSEEEWTEAMEILQAAGITPETPLIGIQIGAREVRKQWPAESFTRLAEMISAEQKEKVLLFGVSSETPLAERIKAIAPGRIVNLAGKTRIGHLAALLSRCRLLISNDTGTSHLAAAVGTRVLSLHMGHVWFRETSPYGEGHAAMQADCPCAPCSLRTPCSDMRCRRILTPSAVHHTLRYILNRTPIPDDDTFRNIKVHESYFGDGNFLSHRPLLHRSETLEDRFREIYDQFWKKRLNGLPQGTKVFPASSGIPGREKMDRLIADLTMLKGWMEEARSLASTLFIQSREGKGIVQGARRFKELHTAILEQGRRTPLLRPLTEFYNTGQQQIEARDFPSVMQAFATVLDSGCNLLKELEEIFSVYRFADPVSKSPE
ncbi:MAG: glycosyltransferase [Deltaproteobacteria bacterium]|nr:glycosyltransferase [Deltaproteobacteria bacterium]